MSRSRATFQPSYDLIGGGDGSTSPPPSQRQPLSRRMSQSIQPTDSNEALRKEIHKLKYENDSLKQERDLTNVRHQDELRAAQSKADADYKRAQASEAAQHSAASKHESLVKELAQIREQAEVDRDTLERKVRSAQDEAALLREQVEDKETEMADQERHYKHDMNELQNQCDSARRELENTRQQLEDHSRNAQEQQALITEKDNEIATLQRDATELKTQAGDADGVAVLRRELSDQVAHLKELESQNSKQASKLKRLEEQHKSVALVQEEKRQLENKLGMIDTLNRELAEERLQRQILTDERNTWTSYLEAESSSNDDLRFDTPESLAKAFVEVRLERLTLLNKLGTLEPEVQVKDASIQSLEARLSELEKSKATSESSGTTTTTAQSDDKARARVERQRVLAVKEVEYLRAQLKMFDAEEAEMSPEKYNEQHAAQLADMQALVDQHRSESDSLRLALDKAESTNANEPTTGQKRTRSLEDDDGTTARKARKLNDDLSKSETARALLQTELSAARTQIASLKSTSRTRILELRDNPTSAAAAVKQSTLDALRAENEALLSRAPTESKESRSSRSKNSGSTAAPQATVDRLRLDLAAKDGLLAAADKKYARLTESFKKRSLEFREAVASILGWKLDIMPNGRVRVRCMLDPLSPANLKKRGKDAEQEEDEERSIVFDGDKGTMKISGGPASAFARELRPHIEYWVDGRGEVPCFLAASVLDFWERGVGTTSV